jgi:hypothetical protein
LKVIAFPNPHARPSAETVAEAPPAATALGHDEPPRYDRITVRAITIAIVLSLFVHVVILVSPLMDTVTQEQKPPADEIGPLTVSIATPPPPPSPTPLPQKPTVEEPTPTPTPKPQAVKPKPIAPRPPSQIAINRGNTPPFVVPPPTTAQPPTPQQTPTPPVASSFEEELAIRQRARRAQNGGAPDDVVESESERANRIAKANIMAQQRAANPGQDPNQSGGMFDHLRTGVNEAEFVFNGWNRDFQRGMGKTYEVHSKDGDIQMAVVRQMIEIIREREPGDFTWYGSAHKEVVMSARPKDQKELELFLLKEMYPTDPRVIGRR